MAGPEQEVPLPEYPAAQTQAGAAAGESCTQLGGVTAVSRCPPSPCPDPSPPTHCPPAPGRAHSLGIRVALRWAVRTRDFWGVGGWEGSGHSDPGTASQGHRPPLWGHSLWSQRWPCQPTLQTQLPSPRSPSWHSPWAQAHTGSGQRRTGVTRGFCPAPAAVSP